MTKRNAFNMIISMILWACIAITIGALISKASVNVFEPYAIIGCACIGAAFGAWFGKVNY